MRYLCLCEGGNVRSVALAQQLKDAGHDAVSAALRWNSQEIISILSEWADRIVVVEQALLNMNLKALPAKKLSVLEIGPDRWGNAQSPDLHELIRQKIGELR